MATAPSAPSATSAVQLAASVAGVPAETEQNRGRSCGREGGRNRGPRQASEEHEGEELGLGHNGRYEHVRCHAHGRKHGTRGRRERPRPRGRPRGGREGGAGGRGRPRPSEAARERSQAVTTDRRARRRQGSSLRLGPLRGAARPGLRLRAAEEQFMRCPKGSARPSRPEPEPEPELEGQALVVKGSQSRGTPEGSDPNVEGGSGGRS